MLNREIKFRAFENENSRGRMFSWDEIKTDFLSYLNCKDTIVMQFTGLKDKNGVDIYDGDICRILYTDWASKTDDSVSLDEYLNSISHIGTIEYHYFSYFIMLKNRYGDISSHSLDYGRHGFIEIIGNIHENKNLLNEK